MNRQPAAKTPLPGAVLDVFAFAKDGMNPRLLDGECFHDACALQLPAEGLVQQRLLQRVERGELALREFLGAVHISMAKKFELTPISLRWLRNLN